MLKTRLQQRILGAGILSAPSVAVFSPLDLSPGIWLKADAGVTEAAGRVSAWADQSGNSRDFTQGIAANKPAYLTGQQNGLPALDFDGSAYFLSGNTAANALTNGVSGLTVCMVFKPDETTSYAPWFIGNTGGASRVFPVFAGADNKLYVQARRNTGDSAPDIDTAKTTSTIGTSYQYISFILDWVNETAKVYRNGTLEINSTTFCATGSGPVESSNSVSFQIGKNTNGGSEMDGKIGELLFYPTALSVANVQKIEAYLKTRWGL